MVVWAATGTKEVMMLVVVAVRVEVVEKVLVTPATVVVDVITVVRVDVVVNVLIVIATGVDAEITRKIFGGKVFVDVVVGTGPRTGVATFCVLQLRLVDVVLLTVKVNVTSAVTRFARARAAHPRPCVVCKFRAIVLMRDRERRC